MVLVQDMGHQWAEPAAEITQPGHVFLQIGNNDGDMVQHRLLDRAEIVIA